MLKADRVVRFGSNSFGILEGIAHFHAFDGLHRHDGEGEFGFEAAIPLDETAETNRDVERDNFEYSAESVPAMNGLFDFIAHLLRGL